VIGAAAKARRIAQAAVARPDWHNARARLLLQLDERLGAAKDDAAREALLAQLAGDLTPPTPPPTHAVPEMALEDET
jgi:metallo-beta-lactamase family protein